MRAIIWFSLAAVLYAAMLYAAYDAGQRSIVRDCVEFHTFTYARGAWLCKRLKTAKEREREEAEELPAKAEVSI